MDIYTLRDLVRAGRARLSGHARREARRARLTDEEVFEGILTGDLIGTEADEGGTKYRVRGTTFLMKRIVELLCAVEVEEETG